MRKSSRHVLVTAGAGGLGRVIAETFARNGDRISLCDVSEEALAATRTANPGMLALNCDVGDMAAIDRMFDTIESANGPVDILVNNAGIGGPTTLLENVEPDDWHQTIAVSLHGPFYCARRALPHMKRQKDGVIISISSASARTGLRMRGPYVVAKDAIITLSRHIAQEAGADNIRCNAILPGFMRNERARRILSTKAEQLGRTYEEMEAEAIRYVSMRTMIDMDEVADLALYLASHSARHITGQAISVDGNSEWEE